MVSIILAVRRLGQEVLKLLAGLGCRVRETLSLKNKRRSNRRRKTREEEMEKSWHICNM